MKTPARSIVLIAISLMIMAGASLGYPGRSAAQGPQTDYTGVDIVFLVDQSGSMGGLAYGSSDHPAANDPNDLRFSGLQQMVERLAGYRINYFRDSPVQFQTAVIYFGSQIREVVPPTVIAADTTAQWEPQAADILPRLSAEAFRTNLGNTHHLAALQAARATLERMRQSWGTGRHIQAILLLTDGESYVECPAPELAQDDQPTPTPRPQPEYCRDGRFQLYIYRNLLNDYVRANLPSTQYRFYMAAINKDLSTLPDFWKNLIGERRAELVDANTMWAFFEKLLADLTINEPGLEKTTSGELIEITERDRVAIPPYLQEITFIIHKPAPASRVTLKQNGVLLESLPTTVVRDKDEYIESITVRNPRPGFIDIERPVESRILRIFMLARGAEAICDELGSAPQFIPLRLRCSLQSNGEPLPPYEEERYQLTVEAEIHGPSQSQRLRLTPQGGSTYAAYFIPGQTGDYTYVITAKTKDPEGNEITPFRKPVYGVGNFTVKRTVPRLQVEGKPTALLPTPILVRLTDTAGADLQVPAEADPYVQMEALFVAQGRETALTLKRGSRGYEGTYTPLAPGSHQVRLRGQVQDPSTGERFAAFDQQIDTLEVLPPQAIWQGFSSPWPQYRPAAVAFFLADQDGRSMADRLGSDLQLRAEVTVTGGGADKPVELAVTERGSWKGQFIPEAAGEFVLRLTVSAQSGQGAAAIIQNQPLLQFTVRPMTLVRVEIRRPADQSQFAWRDWLWRPQPLPIEAALTDSKGNVLPPAQVLRDPTALPLTASLIPPGGGAGRPLTLAQAGNAPGVFVASFREYQPFVWYLHRDLGWYEVQVKPEADLNDAHTYGASDLWSVRVRLGRHPLWWLLPVVAALLIGGAAVFLGRNTYLYLWPVVGTVTIEGTGGSTGIWTRRLRERGRHTLVFTQRDGLPANLRQVRVHRPLGSKSIQLAVQTRQGVWALRSPAVFGGFRTQVTGYAISYAVGTGEKPPPGLAPDWKAMVFGLLTLGMIAGLGFVAYVVMASLGG